MEQAFRFIVSTVSFLMVAVGVCIGIFGDTVENRGLALLFAILGTVVLFGSEMFHLLLRIAKAVEKQTS